MRLNMDGLKITEAFRSINIYDPVIFQIAILNQRPHQKQIEVLRSPKKHKIIVCGRRSGKTQMIAGEIIRGAITGEYKKQFVVTPVYKQSKIVFNKIIELLKTPPINQEVVKVIHSPYAQIELRNIQGTSSLIDFGSADSPNTLRGEGYDRMFKDESAFIKPEAELALKPLIFDRGGPIWETTTPWGKNELWNRWQKGITGADPDVGCFHYNYTDNPYLYAEGKKEIEKDIIEFGENSVYVQTEILGNFAEEVDVYFPRELVMSCVDDTYFLVPDSAIFSF